MPFPVGFSAMVLLVTVAGAFSLDAKEVGRARRPGTTTVGSFVVAVTAAVATWALLNADNPIHLGDPAAHNLPAGRNCHETPNRGSKFS